MSYTLRKIHFLLHYHNFYTCTKNTPSIDCTIHFFFYLLNCHKRESCLLGYGKLRKTPPRSNSHTTKILAPCTWTAAGHAYTVPHHIAFNIHTTAKIVSRENMHTWHTKNTAEAMRENGTALIQGGSVEAARITPA